MTAFRLPLLMLAICAPAVAAATPLVLRHSGYLLGANDAPVTAPAQSMSFAILGSPTGGTPVWSGTCSVDVQGGSFTAALGAGCGPSLESSALDPTVPAWLEVTVDSAVLTPRVRVFPHPATTLAASTLRLEGQALSDLDTRYARVSTATPAVGDVLAWSGTWTPAADQRTTGTVTQLTASPPLVVGNGATGPEISIPAATTSADGYVTSSNWNVFAAKLDGTDPRLANARTPNGSAGGSLAGSYPAPLVAGLAGRTVNAGAPGVGDVLGWNGSEWTPVPDNTASVQSTAVAYAQLEGGTQTFAANAWTPVTFASTPVAQGVSVAGSALTFSAAGKYRITLSFRADSTCGDIWTAARLFGGGLDRGHSAGSGTAVPLPVTYTFLANVPTTSTTYQIQLGRLAGACTPMTPLAIPDPVNGVPTTLPALQATIVQLSAPVPNLVSNGIGRRWSDGAFARTCAEYLTPGGGYSYSGLTGDGIYTIDPDGFGGAAPYHTVCDMTNGGFTLVASGWRTTYSMAAPYSTVGAFVLGATPGIPFNQVRMQCHAANGVHVSRIRTLTGTHTNLNDVGGSATESYDASDNAAKPSSLVNFFGYSEWHGFGGGINRFIVRTTDPHCAQSYEAVGSNENLAQWGQIWVK